MHGLAVHILYAKGHQRANLFFGEVLKALVGSSIHQQHGGQILAAFALLVVNIPAICEKVIRSLFDLLDFDGLSCFHGDQSSVPSGACKRFIKLFLNILTT